MDPIHASAATTIRNGILLPLPLCVCPSCIKDPCNKIGNRKLHPLVTLPDIADLLAMMPRAVDLVFNPGSGPVQFDEAGEILPVPLLHFALPLDAKAEAIQFLRDHGKNVACYRLDPRGEGMLMIGLQDDGEAKRIAREELRVEVNEGLFGQVAL